MINDRNIRKPELSPEDNSVETIQTGIQPAIQDSVRPPASPQDADDISSWMDDVSEEEQEEGISSWGDEEVGTAQLAPVAEDIIHRNYQEMIKEAKMDASMSRSLSAANLWAEGISQFFTSERLKSASLHTAWMSNKLRKAIGEEEIDPLDMPVYRAAQNLGKWLDEAFPDSPLYKDEFWAGTMAKSSGQYTGQILETIATLGLGGGAKAVWSVNSLGAVGMSGQYYEQARAKGASEEEAFSSLLANTTGAVALEGIAPVLLARRLDKVTGGGLKKLAAKGFKGSMEEGFTEGIQTFYSNAVDKEIYDSTRNLMEGVVEGFAAGALLGGFANITLTGLVNRGVEAKTPEGIQQTKDAIEMINRDYAPIDVEGTIDFLNSVEKQAGLAAKGITVTKTGLGTPLTDKNHGDLNTWQRGWRKFMSSAPQGEAMRNMSEYTSSVIKAQVNKALLLGHRMNEAIMDYEGVEKKRLGIKSKKYGKRNIAKAIEDGDIDATLITRIDGVLRGQVNEHSLPKELRQPVKDMREHVDQLSMDAIKSEIAQGKLAVKFASELGSYLHRSYKLYDPNTQWGRDDIDADTWNKAIAHLRSKIKNSDQYSDKMTEEEINIEAEGMLKQLLDGETEGSLKAIFMQDKKSLAVDKGDKDILQKREDIHPIIRKVMGEYTDPVHNYVTSIEKMSNTFYKRIMFDQMAKQFKGQHFFTQSEVNKMENSNEYRNKLNTGVGSELDAFYMHDDMYDALTRTSSYDNHPAFLRSIYTMNSVAKYSKTVLSHVTIARNIVGGTWFMGFNGLLFNNPTDTFKKAKDAAHMAFRSLPKLDEAGLAQKRIEYDRLGLTGQNVFANEFMDAISDGYFNLDKPIEGNYEYFLEGRPKGIYQKAKKKLQRGIRHAADFYQKGDNFIRIMQYELEKAQLQRADPSITDVEVAELVKDTYQNYGRLNRLTKSMRLAPIAPFLSFPAELVRTATNTAKRARLETQSDNPEIRKIGLKRYAGMVATSIASIGVGAASQMLNNIDDEEDEAYRQLMPEWDRNATLAYVNVDRDGHIRYINTSYTNPYGYISDPVMAIFRGDDDRTILERTAQSFADMIEPLTSEELFLQAADEVWNNKTRDGSEIYNPEDTIGDKIQKQFLHLWNAVEPGTISSVQRFTSAVSDNGNDSKVSDELLGLFGLRISNLDVRKSYGFRIRDYRQRIRDARRVYNSVKFDEGTTESQKREALKRANTQYAEIFEEMQEITDAARKSGVDWEELKTVMKDSGLSNRDINGLRSSVFRPFEP